MCAAICCITRRRIGKTMDAYTLRSVTEKRYYRYFIYYIDIFPKSKQYLLRKGA